MCTTITYQLFMSHSLVQQQRTKHVEMDIHFVREKVRLGYVCVIKWVIIPTLITVGMRGGVGVILRCFKNSGRCVGPTSLSLNLEM